MDEFETSYKQPSYSRENFYVSATDSKGHGLKARVSVPPEVKGRIAAMIASRVFPMYRTEEDVHRDALVHRLHELGEMTKDTSPVWSGELELISRQMQIEAELETIARLIEMDNRIDREARNLLDHRPYPGVEEAVRRALTAITNPELRDRLALDLDKFLDRNKGYK